MMAGVNLDTVTGGPIVDQTMQTNIPGIFAGGNAVHVHDFVDNVSWESEIAGLSASKFILNKKSPSRKINMKAGENIKYIVPHVINCEDPVTLYLRVNEPCENARISISDGIFEKVMRVVRPSEMQKIELSLKCLRKLPEDIKEMVVNCCNQQDK